MRGIAWTLAARLERSGFSVTERAANRNPAAARTKGFSAKSLALG